MAPPCCDAGAPRLVEYSKLEPSLLSFARNTSLPVEALWKAFTTGKSAEKVLPAMKKQLFVLMKTELVEL